MTNDVPTLVVLYTYAKGARLAIAEFRWSREGGVSLTVLDDRWAELAEDMYDNGAPCDAERRLVPRSEAEAFMRALLQPSQAGNFVLVDESRGRPVDGDSAGPQIDG